MVANSSVFCSVFVLSVTLGLQVYVLPGFWVVRAPPVPGPPLPLLLPRTDCYYSPEFFPDLPVSWELNPTLSLTRPRPG